MPCRPVVPSRELLGWELNATVLMLSDHVAGLLLVIRFREVSLSGGLINMSAKGINSKQLGARGARKGGDANRHEIWKLTRKAVGGPNENYL
jgi:hypothetical protein